MPQSSGNWRQKLAFGFPKPGGGTRPSFRAESFCSRSRGGDGLTQGGGAEQIQFSQRSREVMLCGLHHAQRPSSPTPTNHQRDGLRLVFLKSWCLSLISQWSPAHCGNSGCRVENSRPARHRAKSVLHERVAMEPHHNLGNQTHHSFLLYKDTEAHNA